MPSPSGPCGGSRKEPRREARRPGRRRARAGPPAKPPKDRESREAKTSLRCGRDRPLPAPPTLDRRPTLLKLASTASANCGPSTKGTKRKRVGVRDRTPVLDDQSSWIVKMIVAGAPDAVRTKPSLGSTVYVAPRSARICVPSAALSYTIVTVKETSAPIPTGTPVQVTVQPAATQSSPKAGSLLATADPPEPPYVTVPVPAPPGTLTTNVRSIRAVAPPKFFTLNEYTVVPETTPSAGGP